MHGVLGVSLLGGYKPDQNGIDFVTGQRRQHEQILRFYSKHLRLGYVRDDFCETVTNTALCSQYIQAASLTWCRRSRLVDTWMVAPIDVRHAFRAVIVVNA